MADRLDDDLSRDLEFLDGAMRAQLVAIRALLRHSPDARKNLQTFLEHSEKEGFNLNHTEEQDRGMMTTLRQLCS
ncbi:hypothetical protein [Comamonas testosteroni]|uniref:hypothetical protein n=1 Tax=Comamonas testosteroni TaxID=285 RepID=UPI00391A70A4